jgi:hypothetical protein
MSSIIKFQSVGSIPPNDLVSVNQFAKEVEQHPTNLTTALKKGAYSIHSMRGPTRQTMNAITRADADRYIADRRDQGFLGNAVIKTKPEGFGVVYVVAPEPEFRPGRVKVGWTTNLDERFDSWRAVCPNLRVLRVWPTKNQAVEIVALMVAKRYGKRAAQELFDASSVDVLLAGLDAFFATLGVDPIQSYSEKFERAEERA